MLMSSHELIDGKFAAAEHQEEKQHDKHEDGEAEFRLNGIKSPWGIHEHDGAQEDGDLKEDGNAGNQSDHDEQPPYKVSQRNIMRQENRVNAHRAVCNHLLNCIGVLNKEKSFKKNNQSENDPEKRQPFGLMGITPRFDFLYEVHRDIF